MNDNDETSPLRLAALVSIVIMITAIIILVDVKGLLP